MKPDYILDACAMIAAIKQEEGALVVAELYVHNPIHQKNPP